MKQALVEKLLRSTFLLLDLLADLITTAEHHDSSLTLLAECVEILRPHQLREQGQKNLKEAEEDLPSIEGSSKMTKLEP